MQGPTVLVTGGCGYIGSHVVLALVNAGITPVVIDNLSTGSRSLIPTGIPFFQVDAADCESTGRILSDFGCKAVMHLAGSVSISESLARPHEYYRNNTSASIQLIEQAMRSGVEVFIFSSTAAVYGHGSAEPVREDAATSPAHPYGRSKLMVEQALQDIASAARIRFAALRYFNVAGADPWGRCGPPRNGAQHLIRTACDVVLGRRPALPLFGTDYPTPDGTCIRDYVHVSDLASAHVETLKYLLAGGACQIMNCGYGRGISVREAVRAVERVTGFKLPVVESPRRPGDAPIMVAANDRLRATIDWTPAHAGIDIIVATALAWEKKIAPAG